MMGDGKALQLGTSHELGQNFAKAFDTTYLDDKGGQQLVWTTSWGTSTRMVGGLIMAHGDERGLVVPPSLAPHQVVVLVVRDEAGTAEVARAIADELRAGGVRVLLDDKVATSFGRRVTDWEIKGVPLRVEVGPRDLAVGQVTVARRDTGTKQLIETSAVAGMVATLLGEVQEQIYRRALERREARTVTVASLADASAAAATGFARIPWSAVGTAGEEELNRQALSVRCLLRADGSVPESEDEPDLVAIVARSY